MVIFEKLHAYFTYSFFRKIWKKNSKHEILCFLIPKKQDPPQIQLQSQQIQVQTIRFPQVQSAPTSNLNYHNKQQQQNQKFQIFSSLIQPNLLFVHGLPQMSNSNSAQNGFETKFLVKFLF